MCGAIMQYRGTLVNNLMREYSARHRTNMAYAQAPVMQLAARDRNSMREHSPGMPKRWRACPASDAVRFGGVDRIEGSVASDRPCGRRPEELS
jgi:hypothetical protein